MTAATTGIADVDFAIAQAAGARLTRQLGLWWDEGWDLLVTPTLGDLPPQLGVLSAQVNDGAEANRRTRALVPYTTHFNVSGQPAISLPLYWNSDDLPVGVQLVA